MTHHPGGGHHDLGDRDFGGRDHHDGELTGRISGVLQRRAAAIDIDDRLDLITGHGHPARHGVRLLDHRLRRPAPAGRVLLAAVAVVVLVAAGAVLWQRQDDRRLQPIDSIDLPTDIYPVLGDPDVELIEVDPALVPPGPAVGLTFGRRDGSVMSEIVIVEVSAPPAPAGRESAVPPETVRIGQREVGLIPADGPAELGVWMDAAATAEQIGTVRDWLENALAVDEVTYRDQEAAYAEFQRYYADQPEVLDLVEQEQLPTLFTATLTVPDDQDLTDALAQELWALPGVSNVSDPADFAPALDTYEWDEAGAHVTVVGAAGARDVIAALTLTPTAAGDLPEVGVADLPDGMALLDGPPRAQVVPLPQLRATINGTGSVEVVVGEWLTLPLSGGYALITVNGAEGYLVESDTTVVAWPLPGTDLWVRLITTGIGPDEARRIAAGITFTDQASWEARYPETTDPTIDTADPVGGYTTTTLPAAADAPDTTASG